MEEPLVIQTHSGRFHADEVIAIILLSNYYSLKSCEIKIVRSRDKEIFETSDILVDVGMKYDPETLRFDHHQEDFFETWDPTSKIPLSSVGLVWRHYGLDIVQNYLLGNTEYESNETHLKNLHDLIYQKILLEVDAYDNGIKLNTENFNISSLVNSLNGDVSDSKSQNLNFEKAMRMIGEILDIKFKEVVDNYYSFQRDLEIVQKMDLNQDFLYVEKKIPTFYECLNQLDPKYRVKFIIFKKENYVIEARKRKYNSFELIKPLVSEEYLKSHLDNPEDLIFIHKALFIAKTKSYKSAEQIVKLSLEKKIGKNGIYSWKRLVIGLGGIGLGIGMYYKFLLKD